MKKQLSLFLVFFSGLIKVFGQFSGPFIPMVYSTSGDGTSWSNLSGVLVVDNNPAYADLAQFPTCNSVQCYYSNIASFTDFGFSIPGNASITGIQVDAMQRVSSPGGGIRDSILLLSLNGTSLGSDYADSAYWSNIPTMNSYGDSTDTWGYSWTPAEVNNLNFGLQYRVTNDSYDQPASLDFLSMTIYYNTGTGISSQTSVPWNIGFVGNNLNISAESSVLSKGVQVEVRDLAGKVHFAQDIKPRQRKLDISIDAHSWISGIFLVSIISSEFEKVQRKLILTK